MASVDVDLVLVERVPGISSGCGLVGRRLLAFFNNFVFTDSIPDIVLNLEEPSVIKASSIIRIASKNEDLLLICISHSDVLTAWSWEVFSSAFKLGPVHLV